jgi:hypothetical protein
MALEDLDGMTAFVNQNWKILRFGSLFWPPGALVLFQRTELAQNRFGSIPSRPDSGRTCTPLTARRKRWILDSAVIFVLAEMRQVAL